MLRLCIHECRETIVREVAVSARERKNNRRDIMVTVDQLMARSLVTMDAGMSAMEAAKLMKSHKQGSVLITRDRYIVGSVTETDIIRRVVGAERVPYYVPVEEIMSAPVIGIDWRRPIQRPPI
jgi:CBS domain-containing protein